MVIANLPNINTSSFVDQTSYNQSSFLDDHFVINDSEEYLLLDSEEDENKKFTFLHTIHVFSTFTVSPYSEHIELTQTSIKNCLPLLFTDLPPPSIS